MTYLTTYFDALWVLTLEAAPWLVLGLVIGGLFKSLIPTAFLNKHLTKPGLGSIIKAAVLGAPLPLCSCGVIPAAMGLRQAGASKPATTSFLVSTPETGVDSISISYAMLGPFMAIIRPIAALFSALVTGLLVLFFAKEDVIQAEPVKSCCGSKQAKNMPEAQATTWVNESVAGIKYAFDDLLQSILKWLVIGLLFAAAVQAFVPEDWLLQWGNGWVSMVVMLFVGIPMYVCATGSTPIAAGFLMAGISPGAVLVYLLAGPATNMATLGVVRAQMGKRTMWLYLLGIVISALFMGMVANVLADQFQFNASNSHVHEMISFVIQLLSFLLLLFYAVKPILAKKTIKESESCCHTE
ncbi:MAG: SO_0444 family Cu/Zn efflux transporter [Marinicella sp.]|nr:SO_0444 family Cu/Zn efflux transporter [Xanthomonadales bacterium]